MLRDYALSGLRRLIMIKNKELRHMKTLAATILEQRTELEHFFLESLSEVKSFASLHCNAMTSNFLYFMSLIDLCLNHFQVKRMIVEQRQRAAAESPQGMDYNQKKAQSIKNWGRRGQSGISAKTGNDHDIRQENSSYNI